jgi:hypothetical protein
MKALILIGALLLTACGGGDMDPEPADKRSLEYKQWLWEIEGGDPLKFTIEAFCHIQSEHC